MPKRCAAFGCRGNYNGEPYSRMVRFPQEETERASWISAMPNAAGSLKHRTELFICSSHFDCQWVTSRGGKRPVGPPTIFKGVPKSYLKQSVSAPRPTKVVSAESREKRQEENSDSKDRILSFEKFASEVGIRFKNFSITRNGVNISMFCLNENSSKVVQFISFREVNSKFGFLQLVKVCKNGYEIQKHNFQLQKNSLLNRWSQVDDIISVIQVHQASNKDHLDTALKELCLMHDYQDTPHFQFLYSQLQMLLTTSNKFQDPSMNAFSPLI